MRMKTETTSTLAPLAAPGGGVGSLGRPFGTDLPTDFSVTMPDERGHFGPYGGVFVAETLMRALDELKDAYARYRNDPAFRAEYERELKHYVGRPSPVYHAERWSRELGGAQIWLKREDLNHT